MASIKLKLKNISVERAVKESGYLIDDDRPFMTNLQILKYYYLGISNNSNKVLLLWKTKIDQFTIKHLIPQLSNDIIREVHLAGAPITAVTLGAALQAEKIYQDNELFPTHDQFIKNIEYFVRNITKIKDVYIEGETIKFLATISNSLLANESPSGRLTIQDRYFLIFLFLKNSSVINRHNVNTILNGIISDDIINILLKATMKYDELNFEHIIGIVLYDLILFENPLRNNELEINLVDIKKAKKLLEFICGKGNEYLIGGFEDNQSFEIFQFYNIMFSRDSFHKNCLKIWKCLIIQNKSINFGSILKEVKKSGLISEIIHSNHKYIEQYENIYLEMKNK